MANPPSAVTLEEVWAHLNDNREHYNGLVSEIRDELKSFRRRKGGHVVRDLYSRGDRNKKEELKSTQKIAIKLERMRADYLAKQPFEVPDIVGITVVCHYKTEFEVVKGFLNDLVERSIISYVGEPYDHSHVGYYAHHVVVQHVRFADLRCEIQLKTMLHEAWAAKMHDLTYKPEGRLDERLRKMMEGFGNTLESIELQSELIRSLIEERWHIDRDRRLAARHQLQKMFVHHFPASDTKLDSLREDVLAAADKLADVPLQNPKLQSLLKGIEQARTERGADNNILPLLLILVLASARTDGELAYEARRYIDRWFKTVPEGDNLTRSHGLLTRSFARYCLDSIWEAIEDAKNALEAASDGDGGEFLRLSAKYNVASYIAELEVIDAAEYERLADEAMRFLTEAQSDLLSWLEGLASRLPGDEPATMVAELRRELEAEPDRADLAKLLEGLEASFRDALPGLRAQLEVAGENGDLARAVDEIEMLARGNLKMMLASYMDTKGALAIAFGKPWEIRRGLKWCEAAQHFSPPPNEHAEGYYEIRERQACRRLLGL